MASSCKSLVWFEVVTFSAAVFGVDQLPGIVFAALMICFMSAPWVWAWFTQKQKTVGMHQEVSPSPCWEVDSSALQDSDFEHQQHACFEPVYIPEEFPGAASIGHFVGDGTLRGAAYEHEHSPSQNDMQNMFDNDRSPVEQMLEDHHCAFPDD